MTYVGGSHGSHKAGTTSLSYTVNFTTQSGDKLFVAIAYDNATGAGPGTSVSDNASLGNVWTQNTANVANSGTANAGVRLVLASATVNGNMSGKLVTFTFSGGTSVTSKAIAGFAFRNLPPTTARYTNLPVTAGSTGSLNTGPIGAGSHVVGLCGYEGTAITQASDTDGGTWTSVSANTTGGSDDTNILLSRQYKILQTAADVTFSPSWSTGDAVLILAVFPAEAVDRPAPRLKAGVAVSAARAANW